jgi:hypothetical protein
MAGRSLGRRRLILSRKWSFGNNNVAAVQLMAPASQRQKSLNWGSKWERKW